LGWIEVDSKDLLMVATWVDVMDGQRAVWSAESKAGVWVEHWGVPEADSLVSNSADDSAARRASYWVEWMVVMSAVSKAGKWVAQKGMQKVDLRAG
jgi:hypothetical protein